ncbi:type II toxin-antitoxin system VapC family toxin [Caenimonas sp. SL110]|uniref:type II toxin-antitoxin system VapC family toxin n=1 Tax=Caenimonas sp. SL110 TaxID=1450524 RepID=UPI00065340E7|nr:PIN domain-containing protein [Caenimonas sp. SL110]
MKPALIDASAMVALFDVRDKAHRHYRELLRKQGHELRLHSTWPCVIEASHLVSGTARLALLRWIGHGAVQIFPMDAAELPELSLLMDTWTEPRRTVMDLADATLYSVAAQTDIRTIMTLDIRDFSRYRLPDGQAFEIL